MRKVVTYSYCKRLLAIKKYNFNIGVSLIIVFSLAAFISFLCESEQMLEIFASAAYITLLLCTAISAIVGQKIKRC
jgi:hypothetical protein